MQLQFFPSHIYVRKHFMLYEVLPALLTIVMFLHLTSLFYTVLLFDWRCHSCVLGILIADILVWMDKRKGRLLTDHRNSGDQEADNRPLDNVASAHQSRRPNRRGYRVLLKSRPRKHRSARTADQHADAKTSRHREESQDAIERQDAAVRVSLPMKSTRLGPIFGNMRVSERMHREKAEDVLCKKAHPSSRPAPFFQSSSFPKLPESVQRYLREPTLVSFSNPSDELAWLEADATSDGGVSEREPARGGATPKTQRADGDQSKERVHTQHSTEYVYSHRSVTSDHLSQQSTQANRHSSAGRAKHRPERRHSQNKLVTRGTSPILARSLRLPRRSSRDHVSLDEAVQTVDYEQSRSGNSSGSLARSVAIQFASTPAPDSGGVSPLDVAPSPGQNVTPARDHVAASLRTSGAAVPERVLLDTGEVALLIRGPVQIIPLPESRNADRRNSQGKHCESKQKVARRQDNVDIPRKKRPHTSMHPVNLPDTAKLGTLDTSIGFNFNPTPVFRPITAPGIGSHDVLSDLNTPFKQPKGRLTDAEEYGGVKPASTNPGSYLPPGHSLNFNYDEADRIAAEYRMLREEAQSRVSLMDLTFPVRTLSRADNKPAETIDTEPLRRGAVSRVYPRKMF
ncbi:uncharacterized protein LOC129584759 [Paramacrobiotus metropolitanus]|uniref:uncharacterized protein LOC129584759 n=1 Tax=Paramacrobiotus metropolitanus TaxID=2943436 RepID=UPI00244570F4|nr:uncharacterized protein LOC129584759 [Paramacrobiotus metropolitanus]